MATTAAAAAAAMDMSPASLVSTSTHASPRAHPPPPPPPRRPPSPSPDGRKRQDERQRVLRQADRARRHRSLSSGRSRTPSPILGAPFGHFDLANDDADDDANSPSVQRLKVEGGDAAAVNDPDDPRGRLSMPMLGLGLGPSAEEVELLVYGTSPADSADADGALHDGPDGQETSHDVKRVLESLSKMGLDDASKASDATERERELADMVRLLAQKCTDLSLQRDRARAQLHTNRLTALSVISSTKTAHAHALAAERGARDRLDAELEGWKAQAKMLSALLSRAESRSHIERPSIDTLDVGRLASAASSSRLPPSRSDELLGAAAMARRTSSEAAATGSRPSSAQQLQGAFEPRSPSKASPRSRLAEPATPAGEEGRGRDRSRDRLALAAQAEAQSEGITGLGILNAGGIDAVLDETPASTAVLRERNKLAADKRYLKTRLRDTEAQVHRLEAELRSLRPYLVGGGIKLAEAERERAGVNGAAEASSQATTASAGAVGDGTSTAPATPSRSGGRKERSRKKRNAVMGDAETEHLMLAARRLREMRKAAEATPAAEHAEPASVQAAVEVAGINGTSISVLAPAAELKSSMAHASPVKRQASEGFDGELPYEGSPRTPMTKLGERPPKTPRSNHSVPTTPRMADGGVRNGDPAELARPATDVRESARASQHKRFESSASVSSFTGIDELLQAAETLNPGASTASPRMRTLPEHERAVFSGGDGRTRYSREPVPVPNAPHPLHSVHARAMEPDPYGYSHHHHHAASSPIRLPHESPKRRRVSSAAIDTGPFGSPFISDRQPRGRTSTEGADPYGQVPQHLYTDYAPSGPSSAGASQALSALDLLADQAAASLNPSMGSDRSGGYDGVSPLGSLSSDEDGMDGEAAAATAAATAATSRAKRSKSGDASKAGSQRSGKSPSRGKAKGGSNNNGTASASASANDAGQSSSRSNGETRSFGGNQNPEKRLPYVRWTNEEDTKLRAAIKEHGQRWELISRAVGTRSYHQCRQRYLLMRRKEAAAKAQAEADEAANTASASASDQQSQEEGDYGRGPPASASVSRRKSSVGGGGAGSSNGRRVRGSGGGSGGAGGRSTNDERYDDHDGGISDDGPDAGDVTATPLHKLSIGAAPSGGGSTTHAYGPYSPTPRHGALGPAAGSAHSRSLSHPHPHPHSHGPSNILPPVQPGTIGLGGGGGGVGPLPPPPLSPYSSSHHGSTTPTARRMYYHHPASSPLIAGSRQLAPLSSSSSSSGGGGLANAAGTTGRLAASDPTQTTPTNSASSARRMGAALYSQ
ncbi:uncharacterized protein PFL1_04011 [Pseudozyma flocculosa PF-1]|uniref:Uncharacterized protein n=1 Tax=Pseudozyma flocculosa PF-1 TaxID=1277687 RepID=A0A061H5J8_9BASI|nr:uncharacterized protein PFL1_04011 [Pseudozyma flocculosa PF-1]EPQ28182.1 hypothetical protein PFL1_04011 [Pseudozyma flocculosa PF-1]